MLIKIDAREHELFKKCESTIAAVPKFKDIQLLSSALPLGDIIINDGVNDCIIIERKTLSDLAASIKDGRYEEQSYRLNGIPHHNHNIIYLVEGDMYRFNTFKERVDKQTLYSAMVSIHYFKGFSVMRSNTIEETAMMVCNMVYKLVGGLKAGKQGFYSNTKSETNDSNGLTDGSIDEQKPECSDKDYCAVVKKVKKDNITAENIGEIMLCQIPGISAASALAILAQFKTLPNLIKSIQEDEKCLQNVSTVDSNGKSRKISKTVIAKLIEYLKQ
jgi:ERCC4-type nuclease